ncbi:hypothetical protein Q3G72_003759 [Acer saccharum]|nr:hypothetical protein Q3G72_003759 [Acer saccharum]
MQTLMVGVLASIMVVYKGILFSLDCGLRPCVFESDSFMAVKHISCGNFLNANFGSLLEDIANLKKQNCEMEVKAVPKAVNRVAQNLARIGMDCVEDKFWMESFPDSVRNVMDTDLLI